MRLVFCGRQLEDRHTLDDYDIDDDCTLHLITRLSGS